MITLQADIDRIQSGVYCLGTLCKRNHRWLNTEQSVRNVRIGYCIECHREDARRRGNKGIIEVKRILLPGKLYSELDVQRFWEKVIITDGCWGWIGWTVEGYGMLWVQGRDVRAPRFSWELHNDREIPEGYVVRHTCDTPACTRPDHLLIGTHAENIADRNARGRTARGDDSGPRKRQLTRLTSSDKRKNTTSNN